MTESIDRHQPLGELRARRLGNIPNGNSSHDHSHLSNSNNLSSSTRIAVRHIVGGEEDDKEDVLGVIS
ncbi:hypothetical protein ACFX2C_045932 [Malus domestica]